MATQRYSSVSEWFAACPPKGGAKQWKDGYSAKESAKAWFREGHLCLPRELASLLESHPQLSNFRLGTVTPEVCTKLDSHRQGRNADAIVMGVANGKRTLIAIEAKAGEDFGPGIRERLSSALAKTKVPQRIDGLALSVFGRSVTMMDEQLANLRCQLLHAIAGALIEGRTRGAEQVLFAVQYFPNERKTVDEGFADFATFVSAMRPCTEISPGVAVQLGVPGSAAVPANIPFYVGWATAPGHVAA